MNNLFKRDHKHLIAVAKCLAIFIVLLIASPSVWALNPHPRIWLTPQMISDITAKQAASDPDWITIKSAADSIASQKLAKLTIVGASNTNPVQFTTTESLPWNGTAITVYLAGGSGAWAAVNNNPSVNAWNATATGDKTFTIPVDATSLGSFSGQHLTFFMAAGENNPNYLSYGQTGSGWYDAFLQLGLVYKVTGTQAYATQALALLDWINTLGAAGMFQPVSQDSGRGSLGATLGLAIGYDWFYDLLTPAEKTATSVTLNLWNTWTTNNGFARTDPTSNYWEGHVTAAAATGYATFEDNPNAQGWIDWATNNWNTNFAPKFFLPPSPTAAAANDSTGFYYAGLAVTGFNYGGNDISRHVKHMLLVKSATGTDMFASSDYAQRWARNLIYQLKPDRWKAPNFGQWTGSWYGVMTRAEALLLSAALEGKTEGGWAQWIYKNAGPIPASAVTFAEPNIQDRLMFYKASRTALDYRQTEPPYFFSDGGEANVYWRSDWSDTALYSLFQATGAHYSGSTPKYSGHVDLTRGTDYLLVQSNYWKGTGDGTTGSPELSWLNSGFANTLYFWDGGSAAGGKCFDQSYTYDGCQNGFGVYKQPLQKLTSSYAFAQNDFATAYDYNQIPSNRTLQYFFRSFLALGNGYYVVWDRIQSTSAAHTKKLRWHFSATSAPTVSNGLVTSTVGSSKIFAATLLPASAQVSLARNLDNSNNAANWRVEVSDPNPALRYTGLTVFYTTSTSGNMPSATLLNTIDSNFVGVQIADPTPRIAVLPVAALPNGDGTFSSATYGSVTFTTSHAGTGNYLVAGLSPGTYSVAQNGSVLSGYASVTVDNTGVLYFVATAGAFSIVSSGGVLPQGFSAFTCTPSSVAAGSASTCTITLASAAPAPTSVSLSSDNTAVSVPPSVTMNSGAATASFAASSTMVATPQTATLSASLSSSGITASLRVTPPSGGISSLQCSPSSITAGTSTTCTVNLSGAAPTGGAIVSLSDNSPSLAVPSQVTVQAGALSASFTANSSPASSQTVIVTATYNAGSQTASISLQASAGTGTGTYTCTNNQFVMGSDIILKNTDTVDLVGTSGARCTISGNNHRFIVADASWTGHFRMQFADASDLGTASLDILGGSNSGDYAYLLNGYIDIEDSTFHRSSGFTLYSAGTSYIVFRRNTYAADNLVPADPSAALARPWFKEWGPASATKYFQGNRIYLSWIDVGSPNWVIGAAPNCTSCDADGNIMIGKRVGMAVRGSGSYVSYNYSHVCLDLTPASPTWSQVYNVTAIGAGVIAENNIFRTGDWVANGIDGELRKNVLMELDPHNFVRIGNGGLVHHNILLTLYPGLDRYTSSARLVNGDSAIGLFQTGNSLSIYNNTMDLRGSAVKSVVWAINGTTVTSYRNNAVYRLSLIANGCPTGVDCTSAVGLSDTEGFVSPPPSRALYLDYNSFFYDPSSARQVNYDIGVAGKSVCQPGWGAHDVGGCPNLSVDPQFRGPLPIGSGQTGFGSSNDSGFPFNDTDIVGGVYPVSAILSYFRWIYAPRAGSPLVGSQDPQDGPGDIGAVQTSALPPTPPAIVSTNKPPMVYAGPSFSLTDVTAKLSGYAADDGLPSNTLTLQWSKVSGPGNVAFGNPNQALTTAAFSAAGAYVLRLTASDGALSSTSDAQITVNSVSTSPTCDLNSDGAINILDVTIIVNMILGLAPIDLRADLNSDGKVDVVDMQRMINAALGSGCKIGS